MTWIVEHSLMLSLVALVVVTLAWLFYVLRAGAKCTGLESRLQQSLAEREVLDSQLQALQSEAKANQVHSQRLEVSNGQLQVELKTANEKVQDGVKRHEVLEAALQQAREKQQQSAEQLQAALVDARHFKEQNVALDRKLSEVQARHDTLQQRYQEQARQYTRLKTELDEREASHARELANFEQQKASLSEQFKLLSSEILDAKTKALQESNSLSLNAVMNPFQQSIESFKKEVQEIHHRETTQQGELRKELEQLKALNQQITTEAHELSTALRGQKKLQGNWGELVLENVLDRSGLQLGKDYQREVSITTEEGRQRPDAVVYLPQGRHLVIDAKVSLNAYTRFVNAEDDSERSLALKEHVQAVASRIKELADKSYYRLPGLNSPDMVFMFVPIESAFAEALKSDEALFQQAIENNVLVATPTTLLTSLNIVRQLWRYEDQNKHTAALANRAEAVFKKLSSFLISFEKIKKGLETATEAYSKAEGQLLSGKGNLVKQVADFKRLAPAIREQLPSYFADKAALEIDLIAPESISTEADGLLDQQHDSTEEQGSEND